MSSVISIKNADEGIFSGGGIGAPAYRAGDGIYIKDYNISVKHDNKTTKINDDTTLGIKFNDKTLEVDSEGLSAIPYTAGDGINVNNKEISVKYDSDTLEVNSKGLSAIPYTAGDGINVNNKEISVQIDDNTIKINDSNQLYVNDNVIDTDKIWKQEKLTCPIDFYKNFSDVQYDESNMVSNYLDFDMTEDFVEKMPQSHIFDFTLENTDGSTVEFYIAANYIQEDEQYALIVPVLLVDSNGVVSLYNQAPDFSQRPTIVFEFLSLNKFTWLDLLDRLTITVNSKWNGIDETDIVLHETVPEGAIVHVNNFQAVDKLTIGYEDLSFRNGVSECRVSKNNLYEVKSDDHMYNILYFYDSDVPNLDTSNEGSQVLLYAFVLSDEIVSTDNVPIGTVYSYFDLETMDYCVPYFKYEDTHFTYEYRHSNVSAGIAFDIAYTSPRTQYFTGNMRIRWVCQQPAVVVKDVLKANIIEADNQFTYYPSLIPIIFKPVSINETTIDDVAYWYIDWGFSIDSEQFDSLANDQLFKFIQHHYQNFDYEFYKRMANDNDFAWEPKMAVYDFTYSEEAIYDNTGAKNQYEMNIGFRASDFWLKFFEIFYGIDISAYDISKVLTGEQEFKDTKLSTINYSFFASNTRYSIYPEHTYEDLTYNGIDYQGIRIYDLECPSGYQHESSSSYIIVNIEFYETPFGSFENEIWIPVSTEYNGTYKIKPNNHYLYLESISISRQIHVCGTTSLMCYGIKRFMNDSNIWLEEWQKGEYDIIPRPEAGATLYTDKNIVSDGIMLAQNVESHAFSINGLGNNVDALISEVQLLENVCSALIEAVYTLQAQFNMYIDLDIFMGFFELGVGIFGKIGEGVSGGFRIANKDALKGITEGENEALHIGGDFDRTVLNDSVVARKDLTVEGESSFSTLSVSSDLSVEGESSLASTSISSDLSVEGTTTLRDIKFFNATGTGTVSAEAAEIKNVSDVEKISFTDSLGNVGSVYIEDGSLVREFKNSTGTYEMVRWTKNSDTYERELYFKTDENGEWVKRETAKYKDGTITQSKIINEMHIDPKTGEFQLSVANGAITVIDKDDIVSLDMTKFGVKITKTGEADAEMIVDGSVAAKEITASDTITIQREGLDSSVVVHVDQQTGDIVAEYECADAENMAIYRWSKNGETYQLHHTWRHLDTGEITLESNIIFQNEEEFNESILYHTAVDPKTGNIVDSLYDGRIKITVEGEETMLDISNALANFKDSSGNVVAKVDKDGVKTNKIMSLLDEPIFEWVENGEKKTLTIGRGLELIIEGVENGYVIFNYLGIVLASIRAGVRESEKTQFSETGIDMDYDGTKTNPDNESKITITGGEIELKTLNSSKGITIFGKTYKGIVDPNDSSTWTNEYICDGSAFATLMQRLSAINN